MGNLAERYGDPKRSGVYRVSSRRVPVLAAVEAGADLYECNVADVDAALGGAFRQPTVQSRGRPRVLLVHHVDHFFKGDRSRAAELVRQLQAAFQALDAGDPCFVVVVDPLKTLDLPRLWKESATSPEPQTISPS